MWVEFTAHINCIQSVSSLPTVPSQDPSVTLSTVIQLCLSDLLFRCMCLSKHSGAQSQAVKLFCALTNKPSSLTARETSSHSAKMTRSSVVFKRGIMGATVPNRRTGSFHYTLSCRGLPSPRPLHPAETERRHKQCAGTPPSRSGAPVSPHVELQSCRTHFILSRASQFVLTWESLHSLSDRLHLSALRGCRCTHQMLCE